VPPEGITVSRLAELARVRKQSMAQAVDQLERTGYVERHRSRLVFLTDRGASVPPVTHAGRRARGAGMGPGDQPGGVRGPARLVAALADRAQPPLGRARRLAS
jgi:MarR family